MKKYIFYTANGFTQDLNGSEIENCQILGWSDGINPDNAFNNFKKENRFVKNFNFDDILCQELSSEKTHSFSLND